MTYGTTTRPGVGPWPSARGDRSDGFPDDAVDRGIARRFVDVAEHHTEDLALSSPAGTWTYGRLLDDVRRTAGAIRAELGDEPQPVAVVMTHDGPLVVAILSIVMAGHIVVVLDPMAPAAHHAQLMAECRPPMFVFDDANRELAGEIAGPGSVLRSIAELDGDPVDPPASGPDTAVMLAFTSGTSGTPKGGIITHGVLMNLVRGASNALGLTAADRMPMLFPTSLAVAAYPMFLPLLNGGTLATLDVRSVGLAPVAEFLERERITVAYLAPTVVRFLVGALGDATFPDLRLVALGGEVVDAEVVGLASELFGPEYLANGYGTTETGVITLYVIDPADEVSGAVPAGYPVDDIELFILDDRGVAQDPGVPGEVAVASPYVFAGYWGHPELNRQVIAEDPRGRAGWRLYRTGDHGHLDEHGALTVSGRSDASVKIRGRLVVLGDVEARLHEFEELADAAVTARVRDGLTELVAYVVPNPDAEIDGAALRARMLADEESYRVPSRWVVLDELPRLPNGKTDRRSLPTPEVVAGRDDSDAPDMDRTEHERTRAALRDIWEALLPIGSVAVDEDFFEIGGDSLLAAQMLVLAEHRLGVTVPMGELVHARTIRSLAEVVVRLRSAVDDREPDTVACVQAGDASARPRLWFVHDLQGSAYRVRHVAEALGDDQPVWSFESPLLRGEPNRFDSLDTFVARYLTDLRRAQPQGPYWLAGYSFGGICAYEMARQLRRDGEDVAFVGVVDVGPGYRGPGWHGHRSPVRPWFGVAKPPEPGTGLAEQVRHYRAMLADSPARTARHLMIRSGVARLVDPFRFRSDLRRAGRVRPEWRLWYSWEEHWKLAATAWDRQRTYDGRVDLFWADDSAAADATMGWGPLVGELAIHRFAGDHQGVLEDRGAAALGSPLRAAIDTRWTETSRGTLGSGPNGDPVGSDDDGTRG